MVLFPNAKINLGLHVTQKRPDGFHNIETVFYPVPLCDVLELVVARDNIFEFASTGIEIPGDKNENLCIKAWKLLGKDFGLPPVKIHLHKIIPMGAGLGGGSSDGAFMIKLINQVFSLQLAANDMENYARQLGSDCAFFIKNRPVFALGKGDQFEKTSVDISGYYIVIIKPEVHISTKDAYATIQPVQPKVNLTEILTRTIIEWRQHVFNDFEKPLAEKFPLIDKIKNQLYDQGAVFALMSGSGSAVYGIFEKPVDLKNKFKGSFYWSERLGAI